MIVLCLARFLTVTATRHIGREALLEQPVLSVTEDNSFRRG